MQNIEHPNIVTCQERFIEGNKLNIVLEYCEKRDLDYFIKRQNGALLEESEIWRIFLQVCFGVLSLHQRNILHRDLKPANIFMTLDDSVKIGDLGISR